MQTLNSRRNDSAGWLASIATILAWAFVACAGSDSERPQRATTPTKARDSGGESPVSEVPPTPPYPNNPPVPGEPTTPAPDPQASLDGSDVSPDEVQAFAELQIAMAVLQERLADEAEQAHSEAELAYLLDQAELDAYEMIERSSLSLRRFDEIAFLAQKDAHLYQRVRSAMDQHRQTGT